MTLAASVVGAAVLDVCTDPDAQIYSQYYILQQSEGFHLIFVRVALLSIVIGVTDCGKDWLLYICGMRL